MLSRTEMQNEAKRLHRQTPLYRMRLAVLKDINTKCEKALLQNKSHINYVVRSVYDAAMPAIDRDAMCEFLIDYLGREQGYGVRRSRTYKHVVCISWQAADEGKPKMESTLTVTYSDGRQPTHIKPRIKKKYI